LYAAPIILATSGHEIVKSGEGGTIMDTVHLVDGRDRLSTRVVIYFGMDEAARQGLFLMLNSRLHPRYIKHN
jgi:hypothetical protein